jgi:hypothetical protein
VVHSRSLPLSLFLSGIVLFCAGLAHGQSAARLDGQVFDASNAAIPGAEVTLTNSDTGVSTRTISNGSGEYSFAFVLPGSYSLAVSRTGFKSSNLNQLVIHANDRLSLNLTLAVGAIAETVQVVGTAGIPITDSGQRSETLNSQQIQSFATIGRNAEELLPLLPGVVQNTTSGYGDTFDPHVVNAGNGLQGFNINGNRDDAGTYKLDGGNMNDLTGNGGSNIYPNSEFIQELTVQTSNYTADQSGSQVVVTAITKSGTKDFHGEAYWTGRNYDFDANDWTNNHNGLGIPKSHFNYPGFSVSGPISRSNKLFFFFGTEWSRQIVGEASELADVPTAKMLTGDFSDIVFSPTCTTARAGGTASGTTYLNQPCEIKDPLTGNDLESNPTPGVLTGVTSNGPGLLKTLMGPNYQGPNYTDPNGKWNFAGDPVTPINLTQYVGRVDWDPSEKARIFVRLGRQDQTMINPWGEYAFENTGWTSNVPEPTPTVMGYNTRSLNVSMVSLLNPTLTNEFVFNTNVLRQPNTYQNQNLLSKQSLGVNFNGIFPSDANYSLVPQIVPGFGNCDSLNESGCSNAPGTGRWGASNLAGAGNFYKETQFEFGDNLTKVYGAHTLKFGGLIGRARHDQNLNGDSLEGELVTSNWTGGTSGDQYADILNEHFVQYTQANLPVRTNLRASLFEWYAQDNWKVSRRLTLEFGERWTDQQPWGDANGLATTFDPMAYSPTNSSNAFDGIRTASCRNPGQSSVPLCGTLPKSIRPWHPVIQPRLGFAWDVLGSGRAVLRGGFGQYSQRDPTNAGYNANLGPPNLLNATVCCNFNLAGIEAENPGAQGDFSFGQGSAAYNPHDDQVPTVYQYNLTVSSALRGHFFAEISYVGSQSRHLLVENNIDPVPAGALWLPGTMTLNPTYVPGGNTGSEHLAAQYPNFTEIIQLNHNGNANYNSLQATLRRQASHTVDFIASYTYSKAEGQSDQFQSPLPNPFSGPGAYHVLSFDHTQLFSIGYQWYVPKGARGALANNSVARGALNGWMFSGITRASTGTPLFINATVNCIQGGVPCPTTLWPGSGSDAWFGTNAWTYAYLPGASLATNGIYPVYTCNPSSGHKGLNANYLNTSCISLPAFGQQGSFNPPSIRTPGQYNFDLALQKSFHLGEARHLDIRASAFDLFNHANLIPQSNIAVFDWTVPAGATNASTGTGQLTNTTGTCAGGSLPLGFSCTKTGYRTLEASVKFFF